MKTTTMGRFQLTAIAVLLAKQSDGSAREATLRREEAGIKECTTMQRRDAVGQDGILVGLGCVALVGFKAILRILDRVPLHQAIAADLRNN